MRRVTHVVGLLAGVTAAPPRKTVIFKVPLQ